jgi:predicted HAD superfamily Cof-like phosphohydrolase
MENSVPLERTLAWFEEARPRPNLATMHTQLGCHFEEVGEMLLEITGYDRDTRVLLDNAYDAVSALAEHLKGSINKIGIEEDNEQNYLDAICDQLVTLTGCAYDQGFNLIGALKEVNRGNWSKFVDGKAVFDPSGKIAKGPDYIKPDLTPFV